MWYFAALADDCYRFPNLREAVAYYIEDLARGIELMDVTKAVLRDTFSKETYMGHPLCKERPLDVDVYIGRYEDMHDVDFYAADLEELPDRPLCNDYWTPEKEAGVFLVPIEQWRSTLSLDEKNTYDRYFESLRSIRSLHQDIVNFWDTNQYYFLKVEWYKQRGLRPEFLPLQVPPHIASL